MKNKKSLEKELLDLLNKEEMELFDMDMAQDKDSRKQEVAEVLLKTAGFNKKISEAGWDDKVSELADAVVYVPGHWEFAKDANARVMAETGKGAN